MILGRDLTCGRRPLWRVRETGCLAGGGRRWAAMVAAVVWACIHIPAATAAGGAGSSAGPVPAGGVGGWQGTPVLEVPGIDAAAARAADQTAGVVSGRLLQFAVPREVEASSDWYGQWEDAGGGRVVWRLLVSAPGATDTNIGFTQVLLPEGCRLYLTSSDGSYRVGPYTVADNAEHGQLWTPVIPGDAVLVEAEMPAAVAGDFVLDVRQVNSGYLDLFRREITGAEKQGSCNVDVVCPAADGWRDEVRAVARYSIRGAYLCTGSLVMNRRRDFRAYFLTAAHCLSSASEAASVVVYWNYESPNCGDLGGGSLSQSQSGASLRATYAASDFTLLELSQVPAAAVNVYYAGWDPSGAGADAVTCIHHPNGDEKAISFSDTAIESTALYGMIVNPSGNHWRVIEWAQGTTEPGSSGSGLWNAATHRIVGQLHGGYSACGVQLSDWFGKLAVSWMGGGTLTTGLRGWLDPDGVGPVGMDGAYPDPDVPPVGQTYTLTYQAGKGGSIIGLSPQVVLSGASGSPVSALPADGYVFQRWSDGSVANPRTDTNVTADLTVTAEFRALATVPPVGTFTAAVDAQAVAAGQGLWDLSGTYTTEVAGSPLELTLVHDRGGRLSGSAVYGQGGPAPVNLTLSGTVKGASGAVTVRIALAASASKSALSLNLSLDAASGLLAGRITGRLGPAAVVEEAVVVPVTPGMNGTWTLRLDLAAGGKALAGTARLTLANGVECPLVVRGKANGTTAALSLTSASDGSTAKAIRVRTTITPLEGGALRFERFAAKGYGQSVSW